MIRLVETLPPMNGDDLLLYRIRSLWECYGQVSFIQYYVSDNGSAAALFDGQAIVYTNAEDREEFGLFIAMQPDVVSLLSDSETVAEVAKAWQSEAKTYPVMRHTIPQITGASLASVSPRELYMFLQHVFPYLPPFNTWYPDVCYRERHGFCRNVAVCEDGVPISAAMTVAEWTGGALIGCVATTPLYRQRGLAGMCVCSLISSLQKENREVYICPKNEGAERLYVSLGFAVCGSIAQTERT